MEFFGTGPQDKPKKYYRTLDINSLSELLSLSSPKKEEYVINYFPKNISIYYRYDTDGRCAETYISKIPETSEDNYHWEKIK